MDFSQNKEQWKQYNVKLEEDEDVLNFAMYHKKPNVGQVLLYHAMAPGMTEKFIVLVTNKRVIVTPLFWKKSGKGQLVRYLPFDKVRILRESGSLEFGVDESKPLRLSPDFVANKVNRISLKDLTNSIRANQ